MNPERIVMHREQVHHVKVFGKFLAKGSGLFMRARRPRSQGCDITESIAGRRTNPRRFVEDFSNEGLI